MLALASGFVVAGDDWPRTCEGAAEAFLANLAPGEASQLRSSTKADLIQFHFNWGRKIRNDFDLWQGNEELLSSCKALRPHRAQHPDTASMIISEKAWAALQAQAQDGAAEASNEGLQPTR